MLSYRKAEIRNQDVMGRLYFPELGYPPSAHQTHAGWKRGFLPFQGASPPMMPMMPWRCVVFVSALAVLSGCGKTPSGVQYEKGATAVSTFTHASLTVPPEFGLRPTVTRSGGNAIAPQNARDHDSPGTLALLRGAKADQSLPNIRTVIDRDFSALTTESASFIDWLVLQTTPDSQPETGNPESRISPVIQRGEKKGWFFGLF